MKVYQTFISQMNARIREQFKVRNPFDFRHIQNLRERAKFEDIGPCVVMASPGMLQNGQSRDFFEMWCADSKNGVVIPGYTVEGTLARQIMSEPKEITATNGRPLPMNMSVTYVSFSAHSDFDDTCGFVDALKPPHIVFVHGEANEMRRLSEALERKFGDMAEPRTRLYRPRNTESVELHFRGEKMAKAIGTLAGMPPRDGMRVSGVLVKRGFNYHLVAPEEIRSLHTELATSIVKQRLCIPFHADFSLLEHFLTQMYGGVQHGQTADKRVAIRILDAVTVTVKDQASVLLEWDANAVNDMIADSIVAVVLQVESSPAALKRASARRTAARALLRLRLTARRRGARQSPAPPTVARMRRRTDPRRR